MEVSNVKIQSCPKISIITPVYKAEQYLHRCVDSIIAQSFQDWELLLIDDGSPDNSGKICDEYAAKDFRIKAFHKENGGVASARQTGMVHAIGEYLIHVDPDDWIEENFLNYLFLKATESGADVVYCDLNYVYRKHKIVSSVNPSQNSIECLCQTLKGQLHASLCNKLIVRSLYFDNNIFFTSGVNMMEDMSVVCRVLYFANKIAYVPYALYNYNKCNVNSYTTVLSEKSRSNVLYVVNQIESFFYSNKYSKEIKSALRVFKLISKAMLIVSASTQEERRKYIELFPDINYRIYRKDINFSNYIVLMFADKNLYMANVISLLKRILRWCKFKLNIL